MSIDSGGIEDDVIDFISREVSAPRPKTISLDTDLRVDCRMIWEDAETIMARFFVRFSVDHGDFDLRRYFPTEGGVLSSLLASIAGRKAVKVTPPGLTVKMLCRASAAQVWHTEMVEA